MAFYHTACFVFTIMIICNAVLYPTFFSSIFRMWFGGKAPEEEKEPIPDYPPHLRGGGGRGGRMAMKQGPGPGAGGRPPMGASSPDTSSFMAHQQQESSRGKGMMGTVLPIYALGIFIYFGYVIYKVFLRDKPASSSRPSSWGYPSDEEFRDGPTPRREQQEKLQRQLAAELKAANYAELKKNEKRSASAAATPREGSPKKDAPSGSTEEVDVLKQRLAETEKNMQRMMDMMNSMGVAMNQVSQHLASANDDKPIPTTVLSKLNDPDDDDDRDIDAAQLALDVDTLSDEEDLLIGDRMEDGLLASSDEDDEENDVSSPKEADVDDIDVRRPNKMNIVDVEADDEEGEGEVDSDDESEVENIGADEDGSDGGFAGETLRRRNVRATECSEGAGIEG